jgi:hypothetical protein
VATIYVSFIQSLDNYLPNAYFVPAIYVGLGVRVLKTKEGKSICPYRAFGGVFR